MRRFTAFFLVALLFLWSIACNCNLGPVIIEQFKASAIDDGQPLNRQIIVLLPPVSTFTVTSTSTATSTPTATPTETATPTAKDTSTATKEATATKTPSSTATASSTPTETSTPTPTDTATATSTSTSTPTATSTDRPAKPPTSTPTPDPKLVVNTADDNDDGTCDENHCSLREAINAANANSGEDTIVFDIPAAGVQTITPDSNLPGITDPVTIDGLTQPGAGSGNLLIELNGNYNSAVTSGLIISGADVTVAGLMIRDFYGSGIINNGVATVQDLTISGNDADQGGGIYNSGAGSTLTVNNSSISGNGALEGGGIYNSGGIVTINSSDISSNSTEGNGSGIYNIAGGVTGGGILIVDRSTLNSNSGSGVYNDGLATITRSTFSGNARGIFNGDGVVSADNCTFNNNSTGFGAGIYNDSGGTITVNNSTFSNNTAYFEGGGIYNNGVAATVYNSTISGNDASNSDGGGIYTESSITVINSTIVRNAGYMSGGGIAYGDQGDIVIVQNSIIADNSPDNCFTILGIIGSGGHNLVSDSSCGFGSTGDIVTSPTLLGPLQNNGGSTQTHALQTGSPAIDAGSCPGSTTDQRGSTRPVDQAGVNNADDGCDIGAYELQ